MNNQKYDASYLKALDLYRQGRHWDAHEALEDAWRAEEDPIRKLFYHGIIQLAAAFHHLEKENMHGVKTLIRKSKDKLEKCPPFYLGIDVSSVLREIESCQREAEVVERGDRKAFGWKLKPCLCLHSEKE